MNETGNGIDSLENVQSKHFTAEQINFLQEKFPEASIEKFDNLYEKSYYKIQEKYLKVITTIKDVTILMPSTT